MPQICKVCAHSKTKEIEKQYLSGKPKTHIARQHGLNVQSVDYHMDNHLSQKLVRSFQKKEEKHAENMLEGINDLLDRTKNILDEAEEKGQKTLALKAIKEARSTYELLSKIAVKLEEYRRADEKKEQGHARQQISEGLQALSDNELMAYIQLQAKIYEATPDYKLDPKAQMVVDVVSSGYGSSQSVNDDANGVDPSGQSDAGQSKSPRNGSGQDRNSVNTDDDLELNDLDDLDLSLDDENTISSEDDDPDYIVEERRRQNRLL